MTSVEARLHRLEVAAALCSGEESLEEAVNRAAAEYGLDAASVLAEAKRILADPVDLRTVLERSAAELGIDPGRLGAEVDRVMARLGWAR